MRKVRKITEEEENFRLETTERFGPRVGFVRRDYVEPEPVGTYIAMVFRVEGYTKDCDGSAMVTLAHVNRHGDDTGWRPNSLDLNPESEVVLDHPAELHELLEQTFLRIEGDLSDERMKELIAEWETNAKPWVIIGEAQEGKE